MPKIRLFALFLIIFICSCVKPKEFSNIPYIEYRELFFLGKINNSGDTIPVLNVKFYFQDGNGDIGAINNVGSPNLFFALTKKISDTLYQQVYATNDTGAIYPIEYAYKLNEIEAVNSNGSIHGTMTWAMEEFAAVQNDYPNDTIRFDIWLFDREGNKSNTIHTQSIALKPFISKNNTIIKKVSYR